MEWSGRSVLANGKKHPEISCLRTVIAIPGIKKNLDSSLPFGLSRILLAQGHFLFVLVKDFVRE